jgi:hypothetical protein
VEQDMPNQDFALTREFVSEAASLRGYSLQLAELAIELAKQAGEPVSRPLSKAQIERAVDVNGAETRLVMDALIGYLERLYREGRLPEDAGVPRW